MNTIARLAQLGWAGFWAAQFTIWFWPQRIHPGSLHIDIDPFHVFLIALSWSWFAFALPLSLQQGLGLGGDA
jgi:hypothetical protein